MLEYAEMEKLMSEPRRLLNSSSEKPTVDFLLSYYYFIWSLDSYTLTFFCFVEYTLVKCFNNFVQAAVSAPRQEMRIQTAVLLQKLWSCLQTARMVIIFIIAVAIQLQCT